MNRERFFALYTHLPREEVELLSLAYWLSKEGHRPQVRDDGRRYFEHPRDLNVLLVGRGFDDLQTGIVALLHDNPEDTFTPPVIIAKLFGIESCSSVLALSKVVRIYDETGKVVRVQKKDPDEYWGGIANGSFLIRIVKCGDRYLNFNDMENWSRKRRLAYALETEERVIPIAENTDRRFADELKARLVEVRAG